MPRKRAMATKRKAANNAARLDSADEPADDSVGLMRSLAPLRGTLTHGAARLRERLASSRGRLMVIATAAVLALVMLGVQTRSPAPDAAPAIRTLPLATGESGDTATGSPAVATLSADEPELPEPATHPAAERIPQATPEPAWAYVQVARGDTLELIFRRLGLSARLLHDIVRLDDNTRNLARLLPGDELAFEIDESDGFRMLRAEFDDEHWLFVDQTADGLSSRLEPRDLEVRVVEVQAEIDSSLFNAGKNAGLSDNMILRLAAIFGWDIDFALDIRRGDRFALVFEEIYRDGQFLRQGAILGARFINQGKSFEAVRFDAGYGPDYFDPQGRPMRKAFLRAPLNFTRVTSNFNPRRFHPVTRRVRPHNGTDYGAATGTPVWAAGDGTVIEAGYGAANGNYIFIQHGNHIVTRYLHLSRKSVKRGDRVRQGQTIGQVGATGLATGPHLHYEFLVHGRHRDPRKVDLPEAQPLPEDKLPEFQAQTSAMFAQLAEMLPPQVMLASSAERGHAGADAESLVAPK